MIRKATIKDMEPIQALRRQLLKHKGRDLRNSDELVKTYLERGHSVFFLAEIDGKPAGFIHAYDDYIQDLYVIPGQRNKGIGTRLLKKLPKKNYRVTTDNPRFYFKNGFRKQEKNIYSKTL